MPILSLFIVIYIIGSKFWWLNSSPSWRKSFSLKRMAPVSCICVVIYKIFPPLIVQSTDQPGGRGKSSEPWLAKFPNDVAATLPIPEKKKRRDRTMIIAKRYTIWKNSKLSKLYLPLKTMIFTVTNKIFLKTSQCYCYLITKGEKNYHLCN